MTSTPAPRLSVRIRVQIALIVVAAVATLLATYQFGEASGAYQDSVRQDIKRQGAVLEDIRSVYGDEAPLAFRVAAAQVRADRLRPMKGQGRLAASEYALAAQTAFGLRNAKDAPPLLKSDRYRNKDLGYDLPGRLADIQKRSPGLYGLDPDATLRGGDRQVTWGLVFAGVAGAAVVALVLGACVLRPTRWRRPPAPSSRRILRGLDLVPQPATATDHRGTVVIHLTVTTMLLLLPLGQIFAAGIEQRALAEATRKEVRIGTSVSAYGQRSAFLTEALQAAVIEDLQATAREWASLDTGTSTEDVSHEQAVAVVEGGIALQTKAIAEYMGRAPTDEDGLDATSIAALSKEPKNLTALQTEQSRQVDLAEQAGDRGLFLSVATAAAVVAEILAGTALAALARSGSRIWTLSAVAAGSVSALLTFAALA